LNNNTSGFIHPSTRTRQSRALLILLSDLLSLDHRSEISLSTLEHSASRSSIHASGASRHTIAHARALRAIVVAATVVNTNHGHFSKVVTIAGLLALLCAIVSGIADVDSRCIGTAGAKTALALTRAGVCWDLLVGLADIGLGATVGVGCSRRPGCAGHGDSGSGCGSGCQAGEQDSRGCGCGCGKNSRGST